MILTVADTLKPMNWRYNSIGHTELPIAIIDPLLNKIISFPQGFLSDLLKKANRHYDDKKMNEYTQTIVSRHTQFTHRHTHTQTLFNLCFFLQLKMFDLNGDGKLGLSEMARWEGLCASWSEYVLKQYFIKCFFVFRLLPVQENFLLKFQVRSSSVHNVRFNSTLLPLCRVQVKYSCSSEQQRVIIRLWVWSRECMNWLCMSFPENAKFFLFD